MVIFNALNIGRKIAKSSFLGFLVLSGICMNVDASPQTKQTQRKYNMTKGLAIHSLIPCKKKCSLEKLPDIVKNAEYEGYKVLYLAENVSDTALEALEDDQIVEIADQIKFGRSHLGRVILSDVKQGGNVDDEDYKDLKRIVVETLKRNGTSLKTLRAI